MSLLCAVFVAALLPNAVQASSGPTVRARNRLQMLRRENLDALQIRIHRITELIYNISVDAPGNTLIHVTRRETEVVEDVLKLLESQIVELSGLRQVLKHTVEAPIRKIKLHQQQCPTCEGKGNLPGLFFTGSHQC